MGREPLAPLPRRAYIGLEVGTVRGRFLVTDVEPDSPASDAGLREGDAILHIEGEPPGSLSELRKQVGALHVGGSAKLRIARNGQAPRELLLTPRPMPLEVFDGGHVELDEVRWRGHRLRALWSWPDTPGPHPLVWLLPGAAWQPEEFPTFPLYPARLVMEQLTARGFATLRIERSGVGDSEGPLCNHLDLEAELEAFREGFAQLRGHASVREDALFVFGRSLGGMLAALLARDVPGLAGLAVWGSACDPWHEALLRSSVRQFALRGKSGDTLARTEQRLRALTELVHIEGLSPREARAQRPDLDDVLPSVYLGESAHGRSARYFQQLQRADVAGAFASLDVPVLAMHGSCDWMSELRDAKQIAEVVGPRGRWLELEGLDHLMHRRPSLQQAFDDPWGGEFDDAAVAALVAFLREIRP